MRPIQKKTPWLGIVGGMILVIMFVWFLRPDATIDPYRVRFCRVSTSPPHQIYYRGHYVPVTGGAVLSLVQSRLRGFGLRVNLVDPQQFSFGTNWCVLLGLTGRMDGRFLARMKSGTNTIDESWMTGAWSTTSGNEHLVFWSLRPPEASKEPAIIEIMDAKRNAILARHKL